MNLRTQPLLRWVEWQLRWILPAAEIGPEIGPEKESSGLRIAHRGMDPHSRVTDQILRNQNLRFNTTQSYVRLLGHLQTQDDPGIQPQDIK